MNGWVEAPPPRKGLGCFARGCLILVVFGVVLALACLGGLYWGLQRHSAIVHGVFWLAKTHSISEAPAPVPEFAASEEQIQGTQERWQDFKQKARAGQPAEIELTADDLNSLIAANWDRGLENFCINRRQPTPSSEQSAAWRSFRAIRLLFQWRYRDPIKRCGIPGASTIKPDRCE